MSLVRTEILIEIVSMSLVFDQPEIMSRLKDFLM